MPCIRTWRLHPADEARSAPMPQETPVVFVVDDDISVRESLELLIRSAGWLPEMFESAQQFLSRPRALVPNCLDPRRQSSRSERARPAEAGLRRTDRDADHLRHRLRRRADDGEGDEGRSRRVPDQAFQRRRTAGGYRAGARAEQGRARPRNRRCGHCASATHRSAVASRRSWRWWLPDC